LSEAKASIRVPSIYAEVLFRQQVGSFGLAQHLGKETVGDLAFEQSVPVLGEGGVMPDLVVHGEPDEPAEQQIVVQLLHQLPLTADGVERHQQLCP